MKYPDADHLVRSYLNIKRRLVDNGWGDEIDWQDDLDFQSVTESDFLRETAWVVLSAGMAERVIQVKFPVITEAFCGWSSADAIVQDRRAIRRKALRAFNHEAKIASIIEIACAVSATGFPRVKECIEREREQFLAKLPYIGPVTALHLAKNLGLDVAKPDRHLVRIAEAAGYDSAATLWSRIADIVGDRVSVVDLVLWRFATQERRYRDYFRGALGAGR